MIDYTRAIGHDFPASDSCEEFPRTAQTSRVMARVLLAHSHSRQNNAVQIVIAVQWSLQIFAHTHSLFKKQPTPLTCSCSVLQVGSLTLTSRQSPRVGSELLTRASACSHTHIHKKKTRVRKWNIILIYPYGRRSPSSSLQSSFSWSSKVNLKILAREAPQCTVQNVSK